MCLSHVKYKKINDIITKHVHDEGSVAAILKEIREVFNYDENINTYQNYYKKYYEDNKQKIIEMQVKSRRNKQIKSI